MSDDESVRQKIWLLVLDKLVLGAIVAAVALWVQAELAESQRLRDATAREAQMEREEAAREAQRIRDLSLEVSRVQTELVALHRQDLVDAVRELHALLNRLEGVGRAEGDDAAALNDIVRRLETAVEQLTLAAVNPELDENMAPFLRLVRRVRLDLLQKTRRPEELGADRDRMLDAFVVLLAEVRRASILALEADRAAVESVLD